MSHKHLNRLGELLEAKNMTRTQLAQKLGYSVSHISRLIYGERALSVPLLIQLVSIFQCEAHEIVPMLKQTQD